MSISSQFPPFEEVTPIIQLARHEDLHEDDVTSRLMIPADAVGVGTLTQKEVGITCGLPIVEMVCSIYDSRLRVEPIPGFHFDIIEGRFCEARSQPLVRIRGPLRSLLSAERVLLNFMQHLIRRRESHPALRPPRRRNRRKNLRHPKDHPRPAPAREIRRPLRRGGQPSRRPLRRSPRQGQPHRRRRYQITGRPSLRRRRKKPRRSP